MTTLNLFRSVCLRAPANDAAHGAVAANDAAVEPRPAATGAGRHPAALFQPLRRCGVSR